ncbi:MAG: hypothetical protein ABI477_19300 [Chryseolinea sp.]
MRLGQIARKLSISPSEILSYLASRNIKIEENANSRLETDHVRLILQKFAPDQLSILDIQPTAILTVISIPEEIQEGSTVTHAENVQEELINQSVPTIENTVESNSESGISEILLTEESEVIKAPKIALSGLKVLGKIDLPEPKKKEQATPGGEEESSVKEEQPRTIYQPRKQSRDLRTYKNPVALQREREVKEESQKQEQKAEQEKERRTQNYLKKVKMSPPTKAVRMVDEPLEQMTNEDLKEEPKSWFGKFIKWLST